MHLPSPFSQSNPEAKNVRNKGAAAASVEIEAQQVGNKDKSTISGGSVSAGGTDHESTWYFIEKCANKKLYYN
jgi:hypothetical protein